MVQTSHHSMESLEEKDQHDALPSEKELQGGKVAVNSNDEKTIPIDIEKAGDQMPPIGPPPGAFNPNESENDNTQES